ncbi:MAG: DUF6672 family protein [Sphaerochaetaceae bacterium]|jgi:hypothetical protein
MKRKCLVVRLIAIVLVIALAVLMFLIGRQHTILVDDKTIMLADGTEIKALSTVEVRIDKQEQMELAARDRDQYVVTGQRHTITVAYTDSQWDEHTFSREFEVPIGLDMVIISIPTLVARQDAPVGEWLSEYETPKVVVKQEEEVVTSEDTGLGSSF